MKKTFFYIASFSLSITVIFVIVFLAIFYLGYHELKEGTIKIADGQIKQGKELAEQSRIKFTIAKRLIYFLDPLFLAFQQKESKNVLTSILTSAEEISSGIFSIGQSLDLMQKILISLTSGEAYKEEDLRLVILTLSNGKTQLALAQTELVLIDRANILSRWVDIKTIEQKVERVRNVLDIAKTVIDVLPKIVPKDAKKTYLVLFQNNMELRPTGGFIGSFGLISFEKGKVGEFTIYDVYDADGKLLGHVEPPMPIRKYLPQVNWFLRDSNWEADFQKSAERAAWFLEKEIDIRVDGVLATDIKMAGLFLNAMGPIYLIDYRETITADNIFEKTYFYTKEDFFSGSRQKKDFLGALLRAIFDKLKRGEVSFLSILNFLHRGLSEKHLQLAFFDPSVQPIFNIHNWGGKLIDKRPIKPESSNDFLAIREANLGVNKANYFVKRSIEHYISIDEEGTFQEALTLNYENKSPRPKEGDDKSFGGGYKNYLRIYVPKNAILKGLSIDGREVEIVSAEQNPIVYEKKGFFQKLGDQVEIEQREEEDLSMIGFLIEILPQSRGTVLISYQLADKIPTQNPSITYSLLVSKQPGTDADPYFLTINYPSKFTVSPHDLPSIIKPGKLIFSSDLSKDKEFSIEFLRKE